MTPPIPRKFSRPLILSGALAAILLVSVPAKATNTWVGFGTPDGSGNFDWSDLNNWDTGVPAFPVGITFDGSSGSSSYNDLTGITVSGITFNATAQSFILSGNSISIAGDIVDNAATNPEAIDLNLALTGNQNFNVTSGGTLMVGGVISGTGFGLTKQGNGTLILVATNTYTGATLLDGGTVQFAANNTGLAALTFGAAAHSTNTSSIDLSTANVAATSLTVQTNSSTANTITIGAGHTLSISGATTIGVAPAGTTSETTILTVTGQGALNIISTANSTFTLGVGGNNNNGSSVATLDLSGLSNFTFSTGTGQFLVGFGIRSTGTLKLASTSNSITASTFTVGDSNNGNSGPGTSTVSLGGGTNTINANTITIGNGKSPGLVQFVGSGGSVTIAGETGGTSTANITVGRASTATGTTTASQLLLAGHLANVQAGTLTIGNLAGATAGTLAGNVTFDTGTFSVATLQLAVDASGSAPNGVKGTFTLGGATPNNTATGVLNVSTSFFLANNTNTTTTTATGTFIINGGTANIGTNITVPSTKGTSNTTLTLAGGTLNMTGHAIGTAAAPVTTVNLPASGQTATLSNLGGTGINGAGLNMAGAGTLILTGNNTYGGNTTINAGSTLQVGTSSQTGTLPASSIVTNNGTLIFAGSDNNNVTASIAGSGALQQAGIGTTTLSGTNNYNGQTDVYSGTLSVTGTLTSTSALNVNTSASSAGILSGTGTISSAVTLGANVGTSIAAIHPGATSTDGSFGTLTMNSLTANGGDLRFDLGASEGDGIMVLNTASLTGTTISLNLVGTPQSSYVVLQAGTLVGAPVLATTNVGRTNFSIDPTALASNMIQIDVTGGPANLSWNNTGGTGDGTTWDNQLSQNWNNTASPDVFYNADIVNFDDSNHGHYNVTVTGLVSPTAVTIQNSLGSYVFSGTGSISGSAILIKNGTESLTISNANTYTGGTILDQGALNLNNPAAIGTGTLTLAGGTLDNTSSGPITLSTNNQQVWANDFTFAGTQNLNLGTGSVVLNATPNVTVTAGVLGIGGSIGNGSGNTFSKSGAGALALSGASTYSGGTTLNQGELNINSASAIGTGPLTINGGSLGNTTAGAVTLSTNNTQFWNGDFGFAGPQNLSLGTGAVTLNSNPNITTTAGSLTIGGVIAGGTGNSLTKSGNGTLILTANSTYSGGATVNGGSLQVSGSGGNTALGSGNPTVNAGGTLTGAGADAFGYYPRTAPTAINIAGGTVTDLATANYRITLPNLNFTGGTLTSATGNTGDANGNYSLFGTGGAITVTSNPASTTAAITAGVVSLQQTLTTFNVAAGTVSGGPTPGVDLLISSTLKNYSAAGSIVKSGNGVMSLTGSSTYTGTTTLNSGSLIVKGSLTGTTGVTVNGGLLKLASQNALPVAAPLTFASGTLGLAGFNETLGALNLSSQPITLDMGGNPAILSFADSSLLSWTGTLNILNWTGSPNGGGSEQILFGNSASALTGVQLSAITFVDPFGAGSGNFPAQMLATGEIVAVPEPGSLSLAASALGILALSRFRRRDR